MKLVLAVAGPSAVAWTKGESMGLFSGNVVLRRLVILLALAIGLACLSGSAEANSAWKSMQGHSECGGITKSGELQEACGFTSAKKIGQAVGTCPKGSFFDIGTWSCFSCPTGFNRNARPVTSPKACDKAVTPKTSSAKFEKKVQCPSGSFMDPRNGGECWSCPSGYGRTAAGVDQWNACGAIGKKAVSAIFKGKVCESANAFRDPRNGGECWSCPEDYTRTANPVTGANACMITLDFEPAEKKAALTCKADEIFDFVDGGTCWKCADGEARTMNSVKGSKACRNKSMKWVIPTRNMYGVFGLGQGADDILAKAVAERTDIDALIKTAAEKTGDNVQTAQSKAWEIINSKPWESPYLPVVLQDKLMAALDKKPADRSASEKNLIDTVSQLIQWNRQFIAYQSKQAFDTWVATSNKFYAERSKQMGAAVIYADNIMTPPDYNELVMASAQAGTMLGAPLGSLSMVLFLKPANIALLPYRDAAFKAAEAGAKVMTSTGGIPSASAMAASAGPMVIALAAAVIFSMEMDKILKMEEYEGKIRQAVDNSNRPVDLKVLFQQKNGAADFSFHWSTLLSAETRPSTYFNTRLAAYKTGTADGSKQLVAPSLVINTVPPVVNQAPATPQLDIKLSPIQSTVVNAGSQTGTPTTSTVPQTAEPAIPEASKAMIAAIGRQSKQPAGSMRFELTNAPGMCLSKAPGSTAAMALAPCASGDTLWFKFDKKLGQVVFADKFCVRLGSASSPKSDAPLYLSECTTDKSARWELTKQGLIKGLGSNNCIGVDRKQADGSAVVSLVCSSASSRQIWRPWAVN